MPPGFNQSINILILVPSHGNWTPSHLITSSAKISNENVALTQSFVEFVYIIIDPPNSEPYLW